MAKSERTSEERYGVAKQPPDTCPMIDRVIRDLSKADSALRGWSRHKEDAEYLASAIDEIEWALSGLTDELERIRTNAANIREWGQGWKELAKEHAPDPTEYVVKVGENEIETFVLPHEAIIKARGIGGLVWRRYQDGVMDIFA